MASFAFGLLALPSCWVESGEESVEAVGESTEEVLAPDGCPIGWNAESPAPYGTCVIRYTSSHTLSPSCPADNVLRCTCQCNGGEVLSSTSGCAPGAELQNDGCGSLATYTHVTSDVTLAVGEKKCGDRTTAEKLAACGTCDAICDVNGEGITIQSYPQTCCLEELPPPREVKGAQLDLGGFLVL